MCFSASEALDIGIHYYVSNPRFIIIIPKRNVMTNMPITFKNIITSVLILLNLFFHNIPSRKHLLT